MTIRIGIISNSDTFIPLAYTLAAQQLQVYLFYSPSPDDFINQKVHGFAKQCPIPLEEEKNSAKDLYRWLLAGKYDACFIIGYKYLIRLEKLSGCVTPLFNVHFGPLPAFRGSVPIFWQLKQGVEKLGLAIHRLSPKFDDGPVVWAKETYNLPHYNYQLVNLLFSQLCVEGVFFVLSCMMSKMPLPEIKQTSSVAAYQKKPGLNDVLVNWQQMEATEICNLVRACNPWNKGAVSIFKGQEVKLMDATIVNSIEKVSATEAAGKIVNIGEFLHIQCKDDKILNVNMLFFQDSFIPAYQCKHLGLVKGQKLG